MRKAALGIGIIALLALAAGAWLLIDPNRFRPQVEALIAEQAGLDLEVRGDLDWQLLPTPAVTAQHIQTVGGEWRIDEWRYSPIGERHTVRGLQFQALGANGRCDLESHRVITPQPRPQPMPPGLVPIQALQSR